MSMKGYFLEKVFDINYRIATHEGDANRRLASESRKILLLPDHVLPPKYRKELLELKALINSTIQALPAPGLTPTKLGNIRNSTAVKYIKMLIDLEEHIKNETEE